jgi:hypothetical protein
MVLELGQVFVSTKMLRGSSRAKGAERITCALKMQASEGFSEELCHPVPICRKQSLPRFEPGAPPLKPKDHPHLFDQNKLSAKDASSLWLANDYNHTLTFLRNHLPLWQDHIRSPKLQEFPWTKQAGKAQQSTECQAPPLASRNPLNRPTFGQASQDHSFQDVLGDRDT